MNHEFNITVAIFVLRIVTGIIFFYQGFDKIVNITIDGVVKTMKDSFTRTWIPASLLKPFTTLTSYIEMAGGLLLVMGLYAQVSLVVLSFNMALIAFAFSTLKAMWDMQHYFPRFVFLIALLLLPRDLDVWSLDFMLKEYLP